MSLNAAGRAREPDEHVRRQGRRVAEHLRAVHRHGQAGRRRRHHEVVHRVDQRRHRRVRRHVVQRLRGRVRRRDARRSCSPDRVVFCQVSSDTATPVMPEKPSPPPLTPSAVGAVTLASARVNVIPSAPAPGPMNSSNAAVSPAPGTGVGQNAEPATQGVAGVTSQVRRRRGRDELGGAVELPAARDRRRDRARRRAGAVGEPVGRPGRAGSVRGRDRYVDGAGPGGRGRRDRLGIVHDERRRGGAEVHRRRPCEVRPRDRHQAARGPRRRGHRGHGRVRRRGRRHDVRELVGGAASRSSPTSPRPSRRPCPSPPAWSR